MKRLNIILIGPPGSGKGTQVSLLKEKFKFHAITVGNILRSNERRHTSFGMRIARILNRGGLVDSHLVVKLVEKDLNGRKSGILFDGFPRDIFEAKWLLKRLKIDLVIVIDVPSKVIVSRLKSRRVCLSGEVFSLLRTPISKMKCKDGSIAFHRADDKPSSIRHRLRVYENETIPVIDFFMKRTKVCMVDGNNSIRKVFVEVNKCIKEYYG